MIEISAISLCCSNPPLN